MALKPKQSFHHTLKEISLNRESPCELVRELISNAYDAKAKNIWIFSLLEKNGLIFFDDGAGLSMEKKVDDVSPYVAFFSIGIEIKTRGEQIGYKCQGSKLCFATRRFTLITKCSNENKWRWITIENPQTVLHSDYDITPSETDEPSVLLKSLLKTPGKRTANILNYLTEDFFGKNFKSGTMIIIEDFQAANYERYFSVDSVQNSYLLNYIHFYTAHGDTRLIRSEQGFSKTDIHNVISNFKEHKCCLKIWKTGSQKRDQETIWNDEKKLFEEVLRGWPYLPKTDKQTELPDKVKVLRKGRFWSRNSAAFEFQGQTYSLIFAIDGKRRALNGYPELGRQGKANCGIPLSSQQGIILSSHGVRICSYNKLFEHPLLENFCALNLGTDHFVFIIDGDFELITSRNKLAEKSLEILDNTNFINEIKLFLNYIYSKDTVFKSLLQTLKKENIEQSLDSSLEQHDLMKENIIDTQKRNRFCIDNGLLKDKWFVEPVSGEEHFVGALYTLFSHIIPTKHKLYSYWKRPLSFSGMGIDAIAINDEKQGFRQENLILIEYKYSFSCDDEFNHPLSITNEIICWDFEGEIEIGNQFNDNFDHFGQIEELLKHKGTIFGFVIGKIKQKTYNRSVGNKITVLNLKCLINISFNVEWFR